jgi:8-oxo-dGTP diphosphatase
MLRHASAGRRDDWTGDDRERPLDERGERQARELVELLAGRTIDAIYTSPSLRCVQTVAPLAEARGLEPLLRGELGEDRQEQEGLWFARVLAQRDVVVCGHRGLEHALPDPPKWEKGTAFVVGADLRVLEVIGT